MLFMMPLTIGLTLSGVPLNATNAAAKAAATRTSYCALTSMYLSMLETTLSRLSLMIATSRFFVRPRLSLSRSNIAPTAACAVSIVKQPSRVPVTSISVPSEGIAACGSLQSYANDCSRL